jgi:hypothetical protein
MQPIEFPEQNVIFAKDQPEYLPLPAFVDLSTPTGRTVTMWELTEEEAQQVAQTRRLYIQQLTFRQPLQPILPSIDPPSLTFDNPEALNKSDEQKEAEAKHEAKTRSALWRANKQAQKKALESIAARRYGKARKHG